MTGISTAYLQRGLTLRHLHLLVELDEVRHVGRVATALNVSQPAVSKALAEIEGGIGVRVFERTPRGLVPTRHGVRLLRFAHTVLGDITRLGDELSSVDQGAAPIPIAVGVMPSIGIDLLPAAIVKSRRRIPDLVATLSEAPMFALLRQLQAGKLDLVVGAVIDQVPFDLVQRPLYTDPIVAVSAPSHPLSGARRPTWDELLEQPWVLPPRASGARKAFEALVGRLGSATPRVMTETVSPDVTLELLQLEPALGLLPRRLARRYGTAGRLSILDVELIALTLPVAVFSGTRAPPSSRIEAFSQSLIESSLQD